MSLGPVNRRVFVNDSVAEVSTTIVAGASERAQISAPSVRGSPLAIPWVSRGRATDNPVEDGDVAEPEPPHAASALPAGMSRAPMADARRSARRFNKGLVWGMRSRLSTAGDASRNAVPTAGERQVSSRQTRTPLDHGSQRATTSG